MRTHNIRHSWPHRMPKSKTRKRAVITKAKTRLFSPISSSSRFLDTFYSRSSFKSFWMDIWCVIFAAAAVSPQETIINPGGKLMLTPTRGFSPFFGYFLHNRIISETIMIIVLSTLIIMRLLLWLSGPSHHRDNETKDLLMLWKLSFSESYLTRMLDIFGKTKYVRLKKIQF